MRLVKSMGVILLVSIPTVGRSERYYIIRIDKLENIRHPCRPLVHPMKLKKVGLRCKQRSFNTIRENSELSIAEARSLSN